MKRLLILLPFLIVAFLYWVQPFNLGTKTVVIPKGATAYEIGEILLANQIIRNKTEFLCWLRLLGKERRLRFGTYELAKYKNPIWIIQQLRSGSKSEIIVTVPEGLTIQETARLLEEKGLLKKDEFLKLCGDKNFIATLGIKAPSLEGFLFPDTYFFSQTQSDSQIVKTFVKNFQNQIAKFGTLEPETLFKILIIASMVEKEAKFNDERPLIAKVFLNRLKRRKPLESCATVIYALKRRTPELFQSRKEIRLSKNDLKIASPYNTYINEGLPPGPICSPGESSIRAVISPSAVDYWYFVSKGNGRHHFSKTYKEHLVAQEQYRAQN